MVEPLAKGEFFTTNVLVFFLIFSQSTHFSPKEQQLIGLCSRVENYFLCSTTESSCIIEKYLRC
jgi:hypothetical protein